METKFKDVAHLYLGINCNLSGHSVELPNGSNIGIIFRLDGIEYDEGGCWVSCGGNSYMIEDCFPILRPLSSMTEEECKYLAWFNMDSEKHLEESCRVTSEEVSINVVYGDGGNLVDLDAAVIIEIELRCFIGQLVIRTNGDLEMFDESGVQANVERQSENFRWILSKGFDLFGLIESGQALDATTLK